MAKWTVKNTDPKGQPHHWYASSIAEWKVDDDLDRLIAKMKKSGYDFDVFRISMPLDAEYGINYYVPQVPADKIVFVGFWQQAK